ncbi:hypothetical protein NLI96_g5444 [Meripilus lineatus]|uniref:Glycopeptide n=1 Tax=Meripilus lineatus TaxID=2056292 RepID=A0AAD5V2R5_9APHY|nr:hypothetical protein NLI96_g5444 [Physisporinus lineatus]
MAPTFLRVAVPLVVSLFAAVAVRAEQHIVRFQNKCGHGTPQLIQGPNVLSTGRDYVSNGPLTSAIAYLQTGNCGFNGENCALVELTLKNPSQPGSGSSSDISLIAPHAYNVETGFSYFGGCDGTGATCSSPQCKTAFHKPDDTHVQVACQSTNVNLLITFCGSSGGKASASTPPSVQKADVPASDPVPVNAASTPPAEASSSPEPSPTAAAQKPVTTCLNRQKKRSAPQLVARGMPEDIMIRASDPRARAMYDAHRRHHAKLSGRYPNA